MDNFAAIAQAIDRGDYAGAMTLLQGILKQTPEDPWAKFYLGRFQEARHQLRAAEEIYRQILKETTQVKLINLARQGIQRLQQQEKAERQAAIDRAMAAEGQGAAGCLILKPMENEKKSQVVAEFARLMHLDPYVARLHLPSRIWRLYRTGAIGELEVYQQELERIGIPAFCITLETIASIPVWRIDSIRLTSDEVIFEGKDDHDRPQRIAIVPGAIDRWVEGLLPIFEQVVDQGAWRTLVRKEKTQDYAHIIDLHCQRHQFILRLCDRSYKFSDKFSDQFSAQCSDQERLNSVHELDQQISHLVTHRQRWNNVLQQLQAPFGHLKTHNNFNLFAEAAFDQSLFVQRIVPHIDLMRAEERLWDSAFHLYSILHWLIT